MEAFRLPGTEMIRCVCARSTVPSLVNIQNDFQELLTAQLVLCQVIACLSCLANDGTMIVKLFDTYTPFITSKLN